MKPVTRGQFENAKKLLLLMPSLPESRVDLSTYGMVHECGTIACPLGHAAFSGMFESQGLRVHEQTLFGQVCALPTIKHLGPRETAKELWGQDAWTYLFSQRGNSPYDRLLEIQQSVDRQDITDKKVAINRLANWLEAIAIKERQHA